jgi:hypothetical protein
VLDAANDGGEKVMYNFGDDYADGFGFFVLQTQRNEVGLVVVQFGKSLNFLSVSSLISGLSRSDFETVEIETSNSLAICFKVTFLFMRF